MREKTLADARGSVRGSALLDVLVGPRVRGPYE